MKLNRAEITMLMRSLLRSMERTPERELGAHKRLYDKLSEEAVRLMPRGRVRAVAMAMDHAIGESGR